jgi:hypothetical protein
VLIFGSQILAIRRADKSVRPTFPKKGLRPGLGPPTGWATNGLD